MLGSKARKAKEQTGMAKRETFYVAADIFEKGLDANAIAVYAFLSYCGNRDGECYPAISTIAKSCGVSVSTVKRTLAKLIACGMVQKKRQLRGNLYALKRVRESRRMVPREPSERVTESHNNSKTTKRLYKRDVPSLYEKRWMEGILAPEYREDPLGRAIEQALHTLYNAQTLTVRGETKERQAIEDTLDALRPEHLDYVYETLRMRQEPVRNLQKYLLSCLFTVPAEYALWEQRCGVGT